MNLNTYIRLIAESINEQDGLNESAQGKHYDWGKDFIFTQSIIQDLKKRNLLGIREGGGIHVMIPINRENAPEYYSRDHFNYRKDKNGNWKDGKEPDFEPYNILHILIEVSAKDRTISISRYFGHRLDWDKENLTQTETDWTDIPVLTTKTVQSLIDMYNTYEVFDKLLDNIIENADKHEEYLDKYIGTEGEVRNKVASAPRYYNLQKELDVLADRRKNQHTWYETFADNCQAITDGDYKSFEWKWDYPEEPTPEEVEKRYEQHKTSADAINKGLRDYYDNHEYTGD